MDSVQFLALFQNPVADSQSAFRALLKSMSEPGEISSVPGETNTGLESSALHVATWCVAQTLFDHDTSVYLSDKLSNETLLRSLQFQCDAKVVREKSDAHFTLITLDELTDLSEFNPGSLECPHESCTVIVQVDSIHRDGPLELSGAGIETTRSIDISGLSQKHIELIQANHRQYPCGIDFVFCSDTQLVALPRTTKIKQMPAQGGAICM